MSTVPALKANGYDGAIVGSITEESGQVRLVYSRRIICRILLLRDGMIREEAEEFIDYNIVGAYMGPGTPLYLDDEPTNRSKSGIATFLERINEGS